jgi:hypothetical protein
MTKRVDSSVIRYVYYGGIVRSKGDIDQWFALSGLPLATSMMVIPKAFVIC